MDWSQLVLKVLSTGIIVIILVAICILLIVRIQRVLAIDNKREHTIKLSNQANFASIFNLSVASAEKMFNFKLLLNDIPLITVPQYEIAQDTSVASTANAAGQSAQAKADKTDKTDKKAGTSMKEGAVKSGKAVAAKAGLLASIMGTFASLLPGSIGSNLRAQSETLRQAQSSTQSAVQAPEDAQRKVESLQQQSGKLAGAKPADATNNLKSNHQLAARSSSGSVNSQTENINPTATKKIVSGLYLVQTQPVDPGEGLSLVLRVEVPKRRRVEGTFAYTLSSQQLPVEALDGEQLPVTKQGVLHYSHVDIWRYWLAPVSSFLVIFTFLFILIFTISFIWY